MWFIITALCPISHYCICLIEQYKYIATYISGKANNKHTI